MFVFDATPLIYLAKAGDFLCSVVSMHLD